MSKLIDLPDGTRIGFPDHLSDEEIEERLRANFAPRTPHAEVEEVRPDERVDFFTARRMSPARKRTGLGPAREIRVIRSARE